ncbi:bacillithiol biosynthesis cysteine-adding enzyme BshC [soil metagenome]
MSFSATYIPYKQTGAFSKIVTDYLDNAEGLQPFFAYQVNMDGIKKAIIQRKAYSTNRALLVAELKKQYKAIDTSDAVEANIEALLNEDTFTICTAHQPNIFTGHLYFIYKIMHAIKLAAELNEALPAHRFIPVYYMGSEDADLEELGEVSIDGKKYHWNTDQKGAVGRMKIDKAFIELIQAINGQLAVEKFGNEILSIVKEIYTIDKTIEQATFEFVNKLFAGYGLLIFLPDNAALKKQFHAVNAKELTEQFSNKLVADSIGQFPAEYKVQAAGREINLFYLKDDSRERITKENSKFIVKGLGIEFNEAEILSELEEYPERFSQNVILRPVYQEMLLPDIAFIGGGGELAYWLELKKVFDAVQVPYPVLLLRNSFMLIPAKFSVNIAALELSKTDLFKKEAALLETLVKKQSALVLQLDAERSALTALYEQIKRAAGAIDITLQQHVEALKVPALKRIVILEKKMLKAEKKKFEVQQRQIQHLKKALFPSGTLQERVDNLLPYYSRWGKFFLQMIYDQSTGMKQEFCIAEESL